MSSHRVEVDRPGSARTGPRRILVTNDDGIDSPGLRGLVAALADTPNLVVAAPAADMSGSGTGMGRYDPRERVSLTRQDLDGVEAYAIDGPPGLAVMAAALGAFGDPPDLVVSGVNAGLNTGHSIIHSGTVGAAIAAHTFGSSGVALSLAPSQPWEWDTTAPIGRAVVDWMLQRRAGTILNVNVPAVATDAVRGARWAPLDDFGHFRVATADVPGGALQLDVTDRTTGRRPDSDTALCLDGYVTLTLLSPVEPADTPGDDPNAVAGVADDR